MERQGVVTTATVKPPYRVPSMAEIRAIPPNGYKVASTFSGCGGSCLGFRMAGFEVVWACEFAPEAAASYRANAPSGTFLDTRDIRKVTAADILARTGLAAGELDVLEGSPPCTAFSTSGKGHRGWGDAKTGGDTGIRQRVDDLFFEYARLLEGLQPRAFVAENVVGLVRGAAKGYFKEILARLRAAGYSVEARALDAQWLGVPQARVRIIFMGVRHDVGRPPAFPRPRPGAVTIREAFDGLPTASPTELAEVDVRRYAIGKLWWQLSPEDGHHKRRFDLWRTSFDRPCPTVKATNAISAANVMHPAECRKFTIPELRRICGFPDDFTLTGTYEQQATRLGNAVPPPMMRAVAEVLRDQVLSSRPTPVSAVPRRDNGGA